MSRISPSKKLSRFIMIKIVFIAAVWLVMDKNFRIGDLPSLAEEAKPATKEPVVAKTEPTPAPAEGKRRGFLDHLLDLPALEPEKVQKDEIGRYMELAERKRRQVDDRINLLKQREDQLKKLESTIDVKLAKLEEERKFFSSTIQKEKDLKGERLDKLVALYEKMEPKKAAPVFEQMDRDLVVEMFKRVNQKQVTKILEVMEPAKSTKISEYYGRVRSGREYEVIRELNKSLADEFQECKGMPAPSPARAADATTPTDTSTAH